MKSSTQLFLFLLEEQPNGQARSEYPNADLKRQTRDKNEKEGETYPLIIDDEDKACEFVKTPLPLPVPEDRAPTQ